MVGRTGDASPVSPAVVTPLKTYICIGPYTIIFTDEFRNVSMTLSVGDWLAGRGGRGRHRLSIEKQT